MDLITAASVSMAVHSVLLVVVGLMFLPGREIASGRELLATIADDRPRVEELPEQPTPVVEIVEPIAVDDVTPTLLPDIVAAPPTVETPQGNLQAEPFTVGLQAMPTLDLNHRVSELREAPITLASTRSPEAKKLAVTKRGGNEKSEKAVYLSLAWLARHQMPDGGWSFDFGSCPGCNGQCRNSGKRGIARNAATALALLPFLAAGQTHQVGTYQKTVYGGLQFLTNPDINHQLQLHPNGANYTADSGSFYTQGLCAMALSEAYAVSEDPGLIAPAQAAINYILAAQDRNGGGWRYSPGQAGDVSVTGWCLMALKSGHMGLLQIDPAAIRRCDYFLTSMQVNGGAAYGYDKPADRPSTSAIGLLLRMYMGWQRENPVLVQGVTALAQRKPDFRNPYFNYYATQVLHQYEGPLWEQWNKVMRDHLIATQDTEGHQAGSWMVDGGPFDVATGGRLYVTSLNCLTLEVYYRFLPLYRKAPPPPRDEF